MLYRLIDLEDSSNPVVQYLAKHALDLPDDEPTKSFVEIEPYVLEATLIRFEKERQKENSDDEFKITQPRVELFQQLLKDVLSGNFDG